MALCVEIPEIDTSLKVWDSEWQQLYSAPHLEVGERLTALTVPTSEGESQKDDGNSSERPEESEGITSFWAIWEVLGQSHQSCTRPNLWERSCSQGHKSCLQ